MSKKHNGHSIEDLCHLYQGLEELTIVDPTNKLAYEHLIHLIKRFAPVELRVVGDRYD